MSKPKTLPKNDSSTEHRSSVLVSHDVVVSLACLHAAVLRKVKQKTSNINFGCVGDGDGGDDERLELIYYVQPFHAFRLAGFNKA